MRALVTGGAGFIGSHLVDTLLERGDEVEVLDDLSTGRRENLTAALEAGAKLVEADVSDESSVAGTIESRPPDAIFHLAGQMDVRVSVSDPFFDARVNVGGTINVLDAARQAGTGRVVFASTGGAIYGEGDWRDPPLALEEAGRGELDQVPEARVVLRQQREVIALVADGVRLQVVAQVGLEAEDRLDPVLLARLGELDGAVHDAVVGQPESGLPKFRCPRGESVDLAGAVEQRVLAVDMEVDDAHALMISVAPDATGTTTRTVRGFQSDGG